MQARGIPCVELQSVRLATKLAEGPKVLKRRYGGGSQSLSASKIGALRAKQQHRRKEERLGEARNEQAEEQ